VYFLAMSNHIRDSTSPAQPTGEVAGLKGSVDSNTSAASSPLTSGSAWRVN
jgi:hypothetical protein